MGKKLALMGHILLILFCISACKSSRSLNHSSYESRVIAQEQNGFYIIRTQGTGINKDKAAEDARRQAVYDLLFKNLHSTYGEHRMLRPIIPDPLYIEKYTNIFNSLLDDKDNYGRYIGKCEEKAEVYQSAHLCKVIMNVAVNRKALHDFAVGNGIPYNN